MILELELGALIALEAAALFLSRRQELPAVFHDARPHVAPDVASVHPFEILKRVGDSWSHVGHRLHGHPDLQEALETPGLAVRHADGSIHEGKQ